MATILTLTKQKALDTLGQVIVSASINSSGHFILTWSNGSTIDAGDFTGIVTSILNSSVATAIAAALPTAVFNAVAGTLFDRGTNVSGAFPLTGVTNVNLVNATFVATLTGNVTLNSGDLPSGCKPGTQFAIRFTQDATGGRTLTLSNFKKAQGTLNLSTAANATDVVVFFYDGTTWYAGFMGVNFS